MALKGPDGSPGSGRRTAVRLAFAIALARKHDARLVGVFGHRALPDQVGVVATWPSADYVAAAQASKAAFDTATLCLRAANGATSTVAATASCSGS